MICSECIIISLNKFNRYFYWCASLAGCMTLRSVNECTDKVCGWCASGCAICCEYWRREPILPKSIRFWKCLWLARNKRAYTVSSCHPSWKMCFKVHRQGSSIVRRTPNAFQSNLDLSKFMRWWEINENGVTIPAKLKCIVSKLIRITNMKHKYVP